MNSKKAKNFLCVLFSALCLCLALPSSASAAITNVTDGSNDKISNAYNMGRWSEYNSFTGCVKKKQNEAFFKFTISSDDQMYIRCSYEEQYEGMAIALYNNNQVNINTQNSPANLIQEKYGSSLYLNCNGASNSQTYYIGIKRGSADPSKEIYFSLSFGKRIRTGSTRITIPGTARNAGNKNMSFSGVDSSILRLNLTNSTLVPNNAIVKRVTTDGNPSSRLGGIHHMIMPASINTWFTSTVSSADSGFYNIALQDLCFVKQVWQFKYNCTAGNSSTMSNIILAFDYQYDLSDTNYHIFINK